MWGFVRETEVAAQKAGIDKTGICRTGLDTYLKAIFPEVHDWQHNKGLSFNKRIRPDYCSESLMLIVEFDGLLHFTTRKAVIHDKQRDADCISAGYKVVRIPFYINLTTKAINKLFDLHIIEPFFDKDVSPFSDIQPNCFCLSGLYRMAKDYLEIAPEQIDTMLASIKEESPLEYQLLVNKLLDKTQSN